MRFTLDEPSQHRFRISDEGLPISDTNLISITDLKDKIEEVDDGIIVNGIEDEDGSEIFSYHIRMEHF
jgi:hypothetical protein